MCVIEGGGASSIVFVVVFTLRVFCTSSYVEALGLDKTFADVMLMRAVQGDPNAIQSAVRSIFVVGIRKRL